MADQPEIGKLSPAHLATLYDITRTLNSSLDFDQVLQDAMDSVMAVTHAERGVLMIADATGALAVRVARNTSGETLKQHDTYSTTIVNQVIETRQTLLTNNAMFDDRYTPGQSIIMRQLRAILCAPMLVQDRLVGVVYVDTAMRSGIFTDADRSLLTAVAGLAGTAIENARLYGVAVEKGRLERELQMAREIQEALLPVALPTLAGYTVAAAWRAAREMAGDFYDVFAVDAAHLGVVIADVSDKGAPAALFMAVARSFIRGHAFMGLSPVETLSRSNDLLVEDAQGGMFVTAYHSVFEPGGRSMHVNAGHNQPILYRRRQRSLEALPRGGRALGWFAGIDLTPLTLHLEAGDLIVYYTDGLTEAENPVGEFYGEARLMAVIGQRAEGGAEQVAAHILNDVEQFCDGLPLHDDLTLVVVCYTG